MGITNRRTRLCTAAVAAAVLGGLAATPAGAVHSDAAAVSRGPALTEPQQKLADALRCHGTPKHAGHEPVLLIHGITSSGADEWDWSWVPALLAQGYDACTVDLPDRGLVDNQRSAEYVVHAIRTMAQRFGSTIDVLGHSQGPLTARWALRWWPDLQTKVDDFVSRAGISRGSDLKKFGCAGGTCVPALWQWARDSQFIGALNAGDETPGAIDYTSLYTKADYIVFPQFPASVSELDGAVNVPLDELCPGRYPEHVQAISDAAAFAAITDAFTHPGAFDPARFDRSTCAQAYMPGVTAAIAFSHEYAIYSSGTPLLFGVTSHTVATEPPLRCYARPGGCQHG